jgi:hypothetical protein
MRTMRKRKKPKRKKTTTGVSRRGALALLLSPLAALGQRQKRVPPPHAVIAGTIFRDPGFAVPGAEATLTFHSPPPGSKKTPKPLKARANGRGEFFFHVPAGEAEYTVRGSAPGLAAEEKKVRVYGEERAEVYFNLKPLAQ